MSRIMAKPPDKSLATRGSLLHRLKDCADQASWRDFYDTYRDLIYNFSLKAGLTETEAEDVVQETVIAAARKLPEFKYDPAVCSFKTWLLNLTMWRIKDQFRKRGPAGRNSVAARARTPTADDTGRTATIERIADPGGNDLQAVWEADWQKTVIEAAMERVKEQANLRDCQMFDLYVLRGWPSREVARTLGVNVGRVYLAKFRIAPLFKKESKEIKAKMI